MTEKTAKQEWQDGANEAAEALHKFSHDLTPVYEQHDLSAPAAANRTFIAFTQQLCDTMSYWFNGNAAYNQDVNQFDKDEMIRRLDQAIRTLRHTR